MSRLLLLLILGVCIIGLLIGFSVLDSDRALFYAGLMLLTFVVFGIPMYKQGNKLPITRSGLEGENAVAAVLSNLPNTYHIFPGFQFHRKKGDVDFAVIGPTGVFVIEVKNHSGVITYENGKLVRESKPLEKNFIKQCHGVGYGLNEFIYENAQIKVPVFCILVFSNPYSVVRFGTKTVQNVTIIRKDWLVQTIKTNKYQLPNQIQTELIQGFEHIQKQAN